MSSTAQRLSVSLMAGLVASTSWGALAHAQQAHSPAAPADGSTATLEEVVVTAQKRTEKLQDVPIAITAFTAKAMKDKDISDVKSLGQLAPNVNLDAGSPFSGDSSVLSASIRGIGQDDFAFNLDPGVGVYLDGVYLARTIGANVALPDVARVEILKGPQGTLFGRNTIGGAISIVTRTPGDEPMIEGQATFGSFARRDFSATADVPISESLLTSFTVSSVQRDGYQKRVPYRPATPYTMDQPTPYTAGTKSSDTNGGQNAQTVRAKIVWLPRDDFTATLTGDWSHQDQSAQANTVLATLPGTGIAGLYNACLAGAPIGVLCNTPRAGGLPPLNSANFLPISAAATQTGDIDTTYANGPSFAKSDSEGAGLTLEWRPNADMTVKSITGFRRITWKVGVDLDGAADNGMLLSLTDKQAQRQISEELQVSGRALDGRLNYVYGLYYFRESGFVHDYVPFDGSLLMVDGLNNLSTSSYAAYAHADYKVTDKLGLTVGARYSLDHKKFEGGQVDQNGLTYKVTGCYPPEASSTLIGGPPFLTCQQLFGFPVAGQPLRYFPAGTNTRDFFDFSPTVGLQYHFTPDMMSYVSWSKGFKAGGWTTRLSAPISNAEQAQFDPEKASTYELGLKSEWLHRRLQANFATFYTDYKHIQLNQQVGASPVLKNLGTARMIGVEFEGQALLGEYFTIQGNAGYIDAKYTDLDPSVGTAVTLGSKLPKTPKWKISLSPEFHYDLAAGGSVHLGAVYTHVSSEFNDSLNTELLRRPTLDMLDLNLRYESPGDKYSVIVGGSNVTNKRYITSGQANYAAGFVFGSYSPPAQWYVTLRAKF
jgi:iron complex outermembrane receptor protein